ncbi:MAG: Rne/Rng family ribonuclease [Leptolyngbyaceae bacterium]|nr:Rne/Rng family ribonuclease [Leptolyngbyaceae bacterium]
MSKQIIIAEQHRIAAVFSEDQIQELIVATGTYQVGDIYVGIVENVLPSIDAAFVNLGDSERNGFIHVSDLGPLKLKRTAGSITELLAPQQKVLVQVMKEPTGTKGPRLTGNVSLPGRYLVLMPYGRGVNLSRRIRNEQERNRLRALAILVKPAGMGLLVRTEAEGVSEEAVIEDLEALQKQWENIQQEAVVTRPPSLLNRDDDFIQRVLRDMYSAEVNRIVADSSVGIKRIKQYLMAWSGGRSPQGVLVDQHRDRVPILEFFRVNAAIREALRPRVDLPSGGYIIIERTEALTVIDVNSGSFTRSATARETVLWTNCEAANEIARQLRLRNIAGVIIVDFIDMDSRRDQLQVLEQFTRALRADKARPQIAQLSELGLVELTRKRQGQNIYELFGRPCPTCEGLGHIAHLPGEPEHTVVNGATAQPVPVESSPRVIDNRFPPRDVDVQTLNDVELDGAADLQELDLLHHPSYQERTGRQGGNRRRRRRGNDSPLSPVPSRGGPPNSGRPVASEESFEASPEPANERSESRSSRGNRSERSERRSSRREQRHTPPEVVVVEMTDEEREMYALMGISPLVLANNPVKDPKNVVINVAAPGEGSQLAQPQQMNGSSTPSAVVTLDKQSNAEVSVTDIESMYDGQSDDQHEENSFDVERDNGADFGETEADAQDYDSDDGDEPEAALKTRRRRRRSSASS